jgi:asparagine synthase (glutamine-hydrolysing)
MCGICGKLAFGPKASVDPVLVGSMLDSIRHRGPDDAGIYSEGPVALGHRRLSIIDLDTGHQPISNEDGTFWIVFNGEIYNYRELRQFLLTKGHVFRTQTDTEVILHLYEQFGAECLGMLRGMFAFAIWDQNARSLFLARDRVGIKPLYYRVTDDSLAFASEIKALLVDPACTREVAPEIIDRFFTFLYLPGNETLLKGVVKLPAGHYLVAKDGRVTLKQYWDLSFASLPDKSMSTVEAELRELLAECVKQHMVADVPVGILLSGGFDSTAVLSLAVESTNKDISSFTVGFADPQVVDERPYAQFAANAFGSRFHETTISAAEFAAFMPSYVWHMEEPVCEPPAIALYYISKLASSHVKVLLSGEGGDEAFAGYSNYRNLLWFERVKRFLSPLEAGVATGLSLAEAVSGSVRVGKYARLLRARFPDYYYSRTSDPYRYSGNGLGKLYSSEFLGLIDREYSIEPVKRLQNHVRKSDILQAMLYIDTKTWLPDDLLIKADKMTMANSVELRVPLLDHKLLEFAASLPGSFKVRGFTTKYIARRALKNRVPKRILNRPKAGFPVPYASWLRGSLREWVRDLLLDRVTLNRGYFSRKCVESLISENEQSGAHFKEVFSLITLELWHRRFA